MPERTLKVTVVGDTKQLQNALGGADKALQTSTHSTTNYGGALTKLEANYAKQQLGLMNTTTHTLRAKEAFTTLVQHMDGAPPIIGQAARSFESMASSIGKSGGALSIMSFAAPVAIAAIGAGVLSAAKHYEELGEKVLAYQRVTGASADESSRMVEVANVLGVSSETLAAGMFKLSKNVSGVTPASEKSAKSLEALGVEVARDSKGNVDLTKTLENVSQAYVNSDDAATRDAIAFAAFGKSGAAMIPILEQGADGLKRLSDQANQVFTQQQLEQVHQYKIEEAELATENERLGNSIGSTVLPVMLALVKSWNENQEASKRLDAQTKVSGDSLNKLAVGAHASARGHSDQRRAAIDAGEAERQGKEKTDEATAAAKRHKDALKEEADAELKLYDTIHAGIDAQFALTHADLAGREAADNVASAEKNLKDAIAQHGATSQEATTATLAYQEAILNQKEAMVRDADATVAAAEATAEAAGSSLSASEKADIFRNKLVDLERNADGPLKEALEGYVARLGAIPGNITTHLQLVSDSAGAHIVGESGELLAYDEGGTVPGPTGSAHLAVVHGGEEVLTPEQQAAMAGGGGGGETHIHVHVDRGAFIDGPSIDRLANAVAQRLSYVTGR